LTQEVVNQHYNLTVDTLGEAACRVTNDEMHDQCVDGYFVDVGPMMRTESAACAAPVMVEGWSATGTSIGFFTVNTRMTFAIFTSVLFSV
jgi:hypothetical protein